MAYLDKLAAHAPEIVKYSTGALLLWIFGRSAVRKKRKRSPHAIRVADLWTTQPSGAILSYLPPVSIAGFPVRFSSNLDADRVDEAYHALSEDLEYIARVLPPAAFAVLCETTIWVNESLLLHRFDTSGRRMLGRGAVFHYDSKWLTENGYMACKAGSIEIYNLTDYLAWRRDTQPGLMLHELAHCLHFKIGVEDSRVIQCFEHARDEGIYDSVPYVLGGTKRAYALNSPHEYFASLSVAYFWRNDYFPFERDDLEKFDARGFHLCRHIWKMSAQEFDSMGGHGHNLHNHAGIHNGNGSRGGGGHLSLLSDEFDAEGDDTGDAGQYSEW